MVAPAPKLATLAWWDDVTLGPDLGITDVPRDQVYEATDWLLGQQDDIEAQLAGRHLREGGIAMFDLPYSWVEGTHCELAARGYSRDGKKGRKQIEYGPLTDPEGRPVAIRVFAGSTADPAAFIQAVEVVRGKFSLRELVMVGDQAMITSARIRALKLASGHRSRALAAFDPSCRVVNPWTRRPGGGEADSRQPARRLGIAQGMNAGVPAPGVVWQRYLNPMRTLLSDGSGSGDFPRARSVQPATACLYQPRFCGTDGYGPPSRPEQDQ